MDKNEVETPLIPLKVQYKCEECKKGYMAFVGNIISLEESYEHTCSHCGCRKYLSLQYPYLKFETLQ